MRVLARLYVVLSCLVLGLVLGGALFLAAAFFIVPEWVGDMSRQATELLEGVTLASAQAPQDGTGREAQGQGSLPLGGSRELPTAPASPTTTPASLRGNPSGSVWATSPQALSPRQISSEGGPLEAAARVENLGGLGGLESKIRRLESDLALWKDGPRGEAQQAQGWESVSWHQAAQLAAWERLREPLAALAKTLDGRKGKPVFDERSDIRWSAGRLASRLEVLAATLMKAKTKVTPGRARTLDSGTLVNLLLEPGAVSDAEALEYLEEMSPLEGRRFLERVSRLAPERAGPLLRGWRSQELSRGAAKPEDRATTRGS